MGRRQRGVTCSDMADELADVTGIEEVVLAGFRPLDSCCVAQRMSWAAHRETTRIEDRAYCLLGIFDINMLLLYGEEDKAFLRLQEEIIRSRADLSVFAWRQRVTRHEISDSELTRSSESNSGRETDHITGVLARSPAEFAECRYYEPSPNDGAREFSISNTGIKTRLRMCSLKNTSPSYALVLPLDCEV